MSAVSMPDMNMRRTLEGVTTGLGAALHFGINVWPQPSERDLGLASDVADVFQRDLLPLGNALAGEPKLLGKARRTAKTSKDINDHRVTVFHPPKISSLWVL